MKKSNFDIYTSDGRINPDKAFALIQEKMKELTPEEFLRIDSTPFEMRGVNRATVRQFPVTSAGINEPSGTGCASKGAKKADTRAADKKKASGKRKTQRSAT